MRSFLVLALLVAASAPAHAETLQEAIAAAYATNPDLASSRAGQRLSAEDAVLARNQLFPTIGANAVFDQQTFNPGNFGDQSRFVGSTVRLTQPVYRGGQTISNIKATKKRLLSGREQLRATENQLVFDTVQAYMNVLANQSEVELNASNVRVLERQLQASSDRFEVGDVTRTDVAQSEARLALARSQLIAAEAALDAASYTFERIVGHVPQNLQPPPPTPPLPGTAQQAIDLALSESPSVISARLGEQASRFEVNAARGARLPSADATFEVGYQNFRGLNNQIGGIVFTNIDFTQNIGATVTIPIYQGGQAGSQIRSAKARADQSRMDLIGAERIAIEQVLTSYQNLIAARATIDAAVAAVDANELALEGTRAEQTVGTRNILDVLNAEQELVNSQVQLVRAERDSYIAAFALLANIGRAEVERLNVPVMVYDNDIYLKRAKRHFIDWTAEFTPGRLTTQSTADVPEYTVPTPNRSYNVSAAEPAPVDAQTDEAAVGVVEPNTEDVDRPTLDGETADTPATPDTYGTMPVGEEGEN